MEEVVILIVYDQHNESPVSYLSNIKVCHIHQNIKIKLKCTFDSQIKPYSSHNQNIIFKWHWNFQYNLQIEDPSNNKRITFVGVSYYV